MQKPEHKIDILLSTYNGELYLKALFDSIIDQSFINWHIIVRDDGSSDDTRQVINDYIQNNSNRITFLNDCDGNIGAKASFSRLLEASDARYVMFCDQDDVWMQEKIQIEYDRITELEIRHGVETPILVFSSSLLTDEKLTAISNSSHMFLGVPPHIAVRFRNLYLRSVILGHTMLFNRRLATLATPIPEGAVMHDWWVSLVAAAFGDIDYIPEPTVRYRQHGKNTLGVTQMGILYYIKILFSGFNNYKTLKRNSLKQLEVFYDRYETIISNNIIPISNEVYNLKFLTRLDKLSTIGRIFRLVRFYLSSPYRLKAFTDLILYHKIIGAVHDCNSR